MTDWAVWPLFWIQLVAFLLFFVPKDKRLFSLRPQAWVTILLLIICTLIVLSLIHDSTDKLNLFF